MKGPRTYSQGTRLALAALADRRCYFPGCATSVVVFKEGEPFVNVDIAHIRDAKPGNRYDPSMSDEERGHFDNLILLCRPHHQLVDRLKPGEYSTELLSSWKREREQGSSPVELRADTLIAAKLTLPIDDVFGSVPDPEHLTPYHALWPKFGIVDFLDHAGALEELNLWCQAPEPLSAIFIDGDGGVGKTRTAVELCKKLQEAGWLAGFFKYGTMAPEISLKSQRANKFIVFDYANDQPNQIQSLLDEIVSSNRDRGPEKTRLLLITRKASRARMMSRLTAHQSASSYLLDSARTISLKPDLRTFDLHARSVLFRSARASFETTSRGASARQPALIPDLSTETYSTPLFVLLAALLSFYDEEVPDTATRDQILERILSREAELFWASSPEPDPGLREEAICVPTIADAASEQEVVRRLTTIGYQKSDIQGRRIANWLHNLYPGPMWANGLEPDLLGEYLLLTRLPFGLAGEIAGRAEPKETASMLRILGRVASGTPGSDVRGSLAEVMATFPETVSAWVRSEREGVVQASDTLDAAAEFLEQIPEALPLASIDIPGRLGPAGARFAIAAYHAWYRNAEPEPRGNKWLFGVNLAGRLLEKHRDEATSLIDALVVDSAQHRPDPRYREAAIRLWSYQARCYQLSRQGSAALDRAMEVLADTPSDEREGLIGLEASVFQQYADNLSSRNRLIEAEAPLDRAIGLRRVAADRLGESHTPALAGSLRARAKLRHRLGQTSAATDDIVEAIGLLREPAGELTILKKDLARCYEVAADIMKTQDGALATTYAQESVDARARLADVFGVGSQLELLSALVRRVQGGEQRPYLSRAVELMEKITSAEKLRGTQASALKGFGRQLLELSRSSDHRRRISRMLAEMDQLNVASIIRFHLKTARKLAAEDQLTSALEEYVEAARVAAGSSTLPLVTAARPLLARMSTTRNPEQHVLTSDRIAFEIGELLIADDYAPDIKPQSMLTLLSFIRGWVSRAGNEDLATRLERTAGRRFGRLLADGALQELPTQSAQAKAFEEGVRSRSGTIERPPGSRPAPIKEKPVHAMASRPLEGDPRLTALREKLARQETDL